MRLVENTAVSIRPDEGVIRAVEDLLTSELEKGEFAFTHRPITTTLGEHGSKFLMGYAAVDGSGPPQGRFELRSPTIREQVQATQKIRAASKQGATPGQQVALILSRYLVSAEGIPMEGLAERKKEAMLTKLPTGDIGYMTLYLQYILEDGEQRLPVVYDCLACALKVEAPTVDLGKRQVHYFDYDSEHQPYAVYNLRHPVKLRDHVAKAVVLGPTQFNMTMLNATDKQLPVGVDYQAKVLANAIKGTDEGPLKGTLSELEVFQMHMKDLTNCFNAVNQLNCEPAEWLNHDCPKCGTENNLQFAWTDRNFFGE